MSLKYKFFLALTLISVIPLGLIALYTHQIVQQSATERVVSGLEAVADIQKKRADEILHGYLDLLGYVSTDQRIIALAESSAFETASSSKEAEADTQALLILKKISPS